MVQGLPLPNDSISPMYPTFSAFIASLFETGASPEQIADKVRRKDGKAIEVPTVRRWAVGTAPGTQLHRVIGDSLGYRFAERQFAEIAVRIGFPPADALPAIQAIRTDHALRAYLKAVSQSVTVANLASFFGLSSRSIIRPYLSDEYGLSPEIMRRVLERLPELALHLAGAKLSAITPVGIFARALLDCRLASGLGQEKFAERHGFPATYIRYLESRAGDTRRAEAIRDIERLTRLGSLLMAERERLKLAVTTPEDGDSAPESPATAPGDLVRRIEALEAQVAALTRGASAGTAYVSPFTPERFRSHRNVPADAHLGATETLIRGVIESLGVYASLEQADERVRILRRFDPLLVELIGAIEAISQRHPGASAVFEILKSWRTFANSFTAQPKKE